jgi:hypothetical protein
LVPLIGTWAVATFNNTLAGLYYPMAITAITLVLGLFLLRDRHREPLS